MLHDSATCTLPERPFQSARRINRSLTASAEASTLRWIAHRAPAWLTPDRLTLLGLLAQFGAGIAYALARAHRNLLWLACLCIVLNWFGDSMDGTLARVRNQQRPRYGFYVDHMVDLLGASALMLGLGASNMLHWQTAAALLGSFLLLSAESYLATYTLGTFELSQGPFGPTELRLLLIAGTIALLRHREVTLLHHHLLLLDASGFTASVTMVALTLWLVIRHTAQLSREETL